MNANAEHPAMTQTKLTIAAPLMLGFAFVGHLLNVLVFEPAIGFSGAEDFYDVGKLMPVIDHPVWTMGGIYHLMAGVAVLILAREPVVAGRVSLAKYTTVAGIGAAVMFVVVGASNLFGMRELGNMATLSVGDMQSINAAFIVFRTVVLSSAALLLGIFVLSGAAIRLLPASDVVPLRYLGMAAGSFFILLTVVPATAPLAILSIIVWGILSGLAEVRR